MTKISLVLPIYNEVAILQHVLDKIFIDLEQIEKAGIKVELIAVNDGCTDGSEDVLAKAAHMRRNLRVINLEGRYGKQTAIIAGMDAVDKQSDATILCDVDIATPVGLFEKIVFMIKEGCPIVYAKREAHGARKVRNMASSLVVNLGIKMFGVDGKYTGKTNIMAFSTPVAAVIRELPERNKFLRTMNTWTGWDIEYISYVSDLNEVEEKNIIESAHARAKDAPRVKSSKSTARDRIREHTAVMDIVWTLGICAVMLLGAGLYFTAKNYEPWILAIVWIGLCTVLAVTFVMWVRAVMVKRVGIIGKKSFGYKIKNVIN